MGIKQITKIVCTCDKCGHQEDRADYGKGSSWGQLSVSWKGDMGSRDAFGNAGGANISGEAWLCGVCACEFLRYFNKFPPN